MRIAVWDEPALDFLAKAASELASHHDITVVREPRRPLRDHLIAGQVDVALLPTLSVFLDAELFDVLPAVALSRAAGRPGRSIRMRPRRACTSRHP